MCFPIEQFVWTLRLIIAARPCKQLTPHAKAMNDWPIPYSLSPTMLKAKFASNLTLTAAGPTTSSWTLLPAVKVTFRPLKVHYRLHTAYSLHIRIQLRFEF